MGLFFTEWSDDLKTDIVWQDFQHAKLFEKMLILHTTLPEPEEDNISTIVEFLEQYSHHHFGIEQEYMHLFEYPESNKHHKEHMEFVKMVMGIKQVGQKRVLTRASLSLELNEWFTNHILLSDKDLAEYLKNTVHPYR